MTEDECRSFIELAHAEWARLDAEGTPRLHVSRRQGESDGRYAVRLFNLLHHDRERTRSA